LITEYIQTPLGLRFHASKTIGHLFWLFSPGQLVALGYDDWFNQYCLTSTIFFGPLPVVVSFPKVEKESFDWLAGAREGLGSSHLSIARGANIRLFSFNRMVIARS